MSILRILFLIPFMTISAWDLPPWFNKTDDQLRHSMDQRWQPTQRVILRPEDKQRIFQAYQAFVERIDAQARQPYIIRRSHALSWSALSWTVMTWWSLSWTMIQTWPSTSWSISSSGQFASAPSWLPWPIQWWTIVLTSGIQITSWSMPTPLTGSQNTIWTWWTWWSGMTEMIWYEYRQRTVVCDILSQLATLLDTHGFALRRDIIGVSNPTMKHRLMVHREILEYLRQTNDYTLTTFYGGTKATIMIDNRPVTQWTCSY